MYLVHNKVRNTEKPADSGLLFSVSLTTRLIELYNHSKLA